MISVTEAKELIRLNIDVLPSVNRPLLQAACAVLAEDVFATIDIPAFEQSSMDGYAINFNDKDQLLTIRGEMAAGTTNQLTIYANETARIFTGAPLPEGADTVVMQEKVTTENDLIRINDPQLTLGLSVRAKGSEIKAGQLALAKDTPLGPAAIGFLAGIGISQVPVYSMPSVSILVTGDELQTPGQPLLPGQVYESNSYSLTTALREAGITNFHVLRVEDNISSLQSQLGSVLEWTDLVLLTGGVSVGDYDFVPEAASRCGVQQIFHRVKQRPGKPLYFGKKAKVPVFGLPGNPSSVLSCFYNYVLIAIEQLCRKQNPNSLVNAKLMDNFVKPVGLTHFLKGYFENGEVRVLKAQASYQLSSFAQANCLIILEEAREDYEAGEFVDVIQLPVH